MTNPAPDSAPTTTVPPEVLIASLQAHLEEANELIGYLRTRLGNVRAQVANAYAAAIAERDQQILDLETQLRDRTTTPGSAG